MEIQDQWRYGNKKGDATLAQATPPTEKSSAKIRKHSQLAKVYRYFLHHEGTTLDCSQCTGIFRNNVTRYVAVLQYKGMLVVTGKQKDRTTGYMAKHYAAKV